MSFLTDNYKPNPLEIVDPLIYQRTNKIEFLLKKILYWLPRLLGLSVPIIMTFFALGIINSGGTLIQTAYALLIQFIPVALIAFILVFAWEWEWVGAVAFTGLAIVALMWSFGLYPWINSLITPFVLQVLGILFFFNWIYPDTRNKWGLNKEN